MKLSRSRSMLPVVWLAAIWPKMMVARRCAARQGQTRSSSTFLKWSRSASLSPEPRDISGPKPLDICGAEPLDICGPKPLDVCVDLCGRKPLDVCGPKPLDICVPESPCLFVVSLCIDFCFVTLRFFIGFVRLALCHFHVCSFFVVIGFLLVRARRSQWGNF